MNLAQTIANYVREQTDAYTNRSLARVVRAVAVAQCAAVRAHLNIEVEFKEQSEDIQKEFMDLCQDVNEFVVLDVKYATSVYMKLLEARWLIARGTADAGLLKALLGSDTVSDALNDDQKAALMTFVDDPNFEKNQAELVEAMRASVVDNLPTEEDTSVSDEEAAADE